MVIVRPSSKYQIAIPKRVRTKLGIKPGQPLRMIEKDNGFEVLTLPKDPVKYLRGILKGKTSMTEELLQERARDFHDE